MSDASPTLAACARWVVTGRDLPDLAALDDQAWADLVRDARAHRLGGVLAAAVGSGEIEGERRRHAEDLEADWALHTMRAEQAMLELTEALEVVGIPYRVLKGAAFAHGPWPAPELRAFGDADVLVPSRHLDATVDLVLERGGERLLPQVRRGFDRRFGKSVTLRNESRVEIDLHRTLVAGPHTFLVPEADLWGEPATVEVAGRAIPCFPPELQVVHAATHAVASVSPRLSSVLDVAFTGAAADLDAASAVAARWKLRAVVSEAGRRLEALLGDAAAEVVAWAAALEPTAEEERLSELFTGERSFRRSARAAAPYIERRVDRVRFLTSLAFPSRAHRRSR